MLKATYKLQWYFFFFVYLSLIYGFQFLLQVFLKLSVMFYDLVAE
jgi:hypothetical protein